MSIFENRTESHEQDVQNPEPFLRLRRGSATEVNHRPLWAPGVHTHDDAMHYTHRRITEIFSKRRNGSKVGIYPTRARPTLVDLGCGAGSALSYLSSHLNLKPTPRLSGISRSPIQAETARKRLPEDIPVISGDYSDPESYESIGAVQSGRLIDGAWMIESFVHSPDAAALLQTLAAVMRPGALLIICDDFRENHTALPDSALTHKENRWIHEFRQGWDINTFVSAKELASIAGSRGFSRVSQEDLSGYIEQKPLRRLPVHLAATVGRWAGAARPAWRNLRGGSALSRLGQCGVIRYQLLVFSRD